MPITSDSDLNKMLFKKVKKSNQLLVKEPLTEKIDEENLSEDNFSFSVHLTKNRR